METQHNTACCYITCNCHLAGACAHLHFLSLTQVGTSPILHRAQRVRGDRMYKRGKPRAIIKRTPLGLACSHALGVSV